MMYSCLLYINHFLNDKISHRIEKIKQFKVQDSQNLDRNLETFEFLGKFQREKG